MEPEGWIRAKSILWVLPVSKTNTLNINQVTDTTLVKLLAETGTTNELLAVLAAPNDVITSELEPFLSQRPYVLATVMRQQGRADRVLALLRE